MVDNNFQYLFNSIGYKCETLCIISIEVSIVAAGQRRKKKKKSSMQSRCKQDFLHTFLIIQVFKTIL